MTEVYWKLFCASHSVGSQYKLLYTLSNNIEVYDDLVPRAKTIPNRAVKFEVVEAKRIVYESLYC